MQVVIEIPEEMYKWVNDVNKFFDNYGTSDFVELIKNGTPLPKGHGDLIDRSMIAFDYWSVDGYVCVGKKYIFNMPVIVPADTEGE